MVQSHSRIRYSYHAHGTIVNHLQVSSSAGEIATRSGHRGEMESIGVLPPGGRVCIVGAGFVCLFCFLFVLVWVRARVLVCLMSSILSHHIRANSNIILRPPQRLIASQVQLHTQTRTHACTHRHDRASRGTLHPSPRERWMNALMNGRWETFSVLCRCQGSTIPSVQCAAKL